MRKIFSASVLVIALCATAVAGDIPNPLNPEPPTVNTTAGASAGGGEMQAGTADSLTEAVLTMIESVLALF